MNPPNIAFAYRLGRFGRLHPRSFFFVGAPLLFFLYHWGVEDIAAVSYLFFLDVSMSSTDTTETFHRLLNFGGAADQREKKRIRKEKTIDKGGLSRMARVFSILVSYVIYCEHDGPRRVVREHLDVTHHISSWPMVKQ